MKKQLSYPMLQKLDRIGADWTDVTFVGWPTLDALEKRGLIEIRMTGHIRKEARRSPGPAA